MSNAELLFKEIEGLPDHYMGEILDFVGYLKHKAPQDSTDNSSGRMSAREALTMGRGIAKRLGSTLTVDRFLELGRQDRILEDALDAAHRKERMLLREKKQRTV
ncbi:hypothetical protein AGMMS49940_01420 [Spirochaetia bacterium]|nr:hypothetical protein AGMMS49940_01420 [Spirochaetia bacterium]